MTDGEIIRRERLAQGVSGNELERIAALSIGQTSRYERGERAPTLDQARRICQALGVSLAIFDLATK